MKNKTLILIVALTAPFINLWGQEAPVTPPAPEQVAVPETPAEGGSIVIEAHGLRSTPVPPPPLFFSARGDATVTVNAERWDSVVTVGIEVLQGKAEVFELGLSAGGEVTAVEGEGIRDWALRQSAAGRVLEIRPVDPAVKSLTITVRASQDKLEIPGAFPVMTLAPGKSVGFHSYISVTADRSAEVRIASAEGLAPVKSDGDATREWKFQAWGASALALGIARDGAAPAVVELVGAKLEGTVDPKLRTGAFVLTGEARVREAKGGSLVVLSGQAAVSALPAGGDYQVRLVAQGDGEPVYELQFEKEGTFPVRLEFQAGVVERNGWLALDFRVPAGAVVPVSLDGLAEDVRFDAGSAVFPTETDGKWLGFLPANGACALAWQDARESGDGKLFFASDAVIETRVGAGLLRQVARIDLKVLQGKLDGLEIELEGAGEILAVDGGNVLGWTVEQGEEGKRKIVIRSARPNAGTEQIAVTSQSTLGDFPLNAAPLRLTPVGAVRHSGYVRVANTGAVRLEVNGVNGMTQLAPEQFPGDAAMVESASQVFVYRFPSAQHTYTIHADQVLPEIGVMQVLVHEMTESDRVLSGQIELDIREAPVREWEMRIPEDYSVVGATGAEVGDYVVGSEAENGSRTLKVIFRGAVLGRQLIEFRLEKNTPAAAGEWVLPVMSYPEAKSVRGFIGIGTVAGYRVTPGAVENLSEIPLARFPNRVTGLQQTFRVREGAWTATMNVEALAQSVQADVFHLYSLKEGIAYGSVLINYFVVGAPVSEWRVAVPETVGNLALDGQNVQGWRRDEESGEVVVTLHQPALGASTLLLTFEQPMSARGGVLRPGEVKPSGIQGERGFIQVVSPSQVKEEVANASPELLRIEPLELPAEFRLLTNSPSLAVYQYAARPFDLELNIQWFEPGETLDQVVDYASLSSRVSRDGQVVTDAVYQVKTRGRKALRLRLPAGTSLWEARVGGEAVNARADGGETLIPLPASLNPDALTEVLVRIGQTAEKPSKVTLTAPLLAAPAMMGTWTVRGDDGHLLAPADEIAAQLVKPSLTETGFQWIAKRREAETFTVLALALVAVVLMRRGLGGGMGVRVGAIVMGGVAIVGCIIIANDASTHRTVNRASLEFVAPVVAPDQAVSLTLENKPIWAAMLSTSWIVIGVAGVALLIVGALGDPRRRRMFCAAGWVAIAAGLLGQHTGAIAFFIGLGIFLGLGVILPIIVAVIQDERNRPKPPDKPGEGEGEAPEATGTAGAVAAVILLGFIAGLVSPARGADATVLADSLKQTLRIEKGRLYGDLEIGITGKDGDTFVFLQAPSVLTRFEGDGLRVTKRERDGNVEFLLVVERDGAVSAKAAYELAMEAGRQDFALPTPRAAVQEVEIRIDQSGWEFESPLAVKVEPLEGLEAGTSGARMVLAPRGQATILMRAQGRDVASEEAQFFAEVSNLFIPGPGLVDGRHKVTVRPSRGQISAMVFEVPTGFTVSDVRVDELGSWRFDPESRELKVEFSGPKSSPFALLVETQQGTSALPVAVTLAPLAVRDAANEVGMVALAFGPDAQPEKVDAGNFSKVSLEDFDGGMLGENSGLTLHQAWRYTGAQGAVTVTVGAVSPEVRVATKQTLSIGDERLVQAVDVVATITRAGLFRLTFALPEGLEIEGASGDALSHWTESEREDGQRVITLHLKGRTTGEQAFAISLAGPAPGAQAEWTVPRFSIIEATRQTGQMLVTPEQGIRVQAVSRTNVSQVDARNISANVAGTLAFRLLQADWELKLRLEALDPWVTAQALQEVTLREGLTKTHLQIAYRVENATVKALRVTLPGLSEEERKTVRASGPEVSDIVSVADETNPDLWEIRFQRRVLGNAAVQIDYQRSSGGATEMPAEGLVESVSVATLSEVRQLALWVTVRASAHLDPQIEATGEGWQRVDWSSVPTSLHDPLDRSVPALAFRAIEPEQALRVKVRRHKVADALNLRVSGGEFTTVFSTTGDAVTRADMTVAVVEKSTLNVKLPVGAQLFNAFVNGQSVAIVREGDAYLFHVLPPEDGQQAAVSLAWSTKAPAKGNRFNLVGPSLNVPLQNIEWKVVLPPGYSLDDADGSLEFASVSSASVPGLAEYRNMENQRRNAEANYGVELLGRANEWKSQGDQEKAIKALSSVSKFNALDAAANEDARVQQRELQTQRAVVGLNTRRQKLYLDNRDGDPAFARNDLLEQAAERNPLLQGEMNYNPQEFDGLLQGNTKEENSALNRVASRIVSQQLAAEPALQAIHVFLPESGNIASFRRSVQVDGEAPMELELKVSKAARVSWWLVLSLALAVALITGLARRGRAAA